MLELSRLAKANPGVEISVRAFRGSAMLDNGEVLTEREDIARIRGEKIAGSGT
ncbi:MAG: hypothetical protein WA957_01425 [Alteraurantiacibacter sp.]